jgi:glycosyltransferase
MTPLLSIVTVCRNAAGTIGETLASVDPLLRAHPEVEHWIIDGASTDRTMEEVMTDPQPGRRQLSEPDAGAYDAMNKGLRLATGKYVWFLNANDFLHPSLATSWASMLDLLRMQSPPVLVGEIQMFKETPSGARPTRYWRAPGNIEKARRFGWHPPHPAFIADRRLLQEMGGFDPTKRIAADFKLMTKTLAAVGRESMTFPHPMVAMREGGISNRSVGQILRANRECYISLRELGTSRVNAATGIFIKLARKTGQKFVRSNLPMAEEGGLL